MGADRVDRIVELINEGLVSAEGQTCGDGVAFDAQPLSDADPASTCVDPECWCQQGDVDEAVSTGVEIRHDLTAPELAGQEPPAIRSDGFTIRRVMEDGTLGEPIEGIIAVEAVAPVFPARPFGPVAAAWAARATPEELADLADCSRDRSFQEWHDSLPWNRDE